MRDAAEHQRRIWKAGEQQETGEMPSPICGAIGSLCAPCGHSPRWGLPSLGLVWALLGLGRILGKPVREEGGRGMVTLALRWVMGWELQRRRRTAARKASDPSCRNAGFLPPGAAGAGGASRRLQETGTVLDACLNPSSAPLPAEPL